MDYGCGYRCGRGCGYMFVCVGRWKKQKGLSHRAEKINHE